MAGCITPLAMDLSAIRASRRNFSISPRRTSKIPVLQKETPLCHLIRQAAQGRVILQMVVADIIKEVAIKSMKNSLARSVLGVIATFLLKQHLPSQREPNPKKKNHPLRSTRDSHLAQSRSLQKLGRRGLSLMRSLMKRMRKT
ncbi:hypothetical protein FGO68_gene13127 [Halteria grandinella]|uniref:Uncharacterized protein n=1 Tax=Halteria grandinella TaxID=5974 RepID=A0A8J8NZ02_HALGN|nr:hypothetical protein FGO68_gene13127 [Halteria grandinella]